MNIRNSRNLILHGQIGGLLSKGYSDVRSKDLRTERSERPIKRRWRQKSALFYLEGFFENDGIGGIANANKSLLVEAAGEIHRPVRFVD